MVAKKSPLVPRIKIQIVGTNWLVQQVSSQGSLCRIRMNQVQSIQMGDHYFFFVALLFSNLALEIKLKHSS